MANLRTKIHCYDFDTRKEQEAEAYSILKAKLKATGIKRMHAFGDYYHPDLDGKEIELETSFLFANQWNTAPIEGDTEAPTGRRVFDWAMQYQPVAIWRKCGHYLEQTPEMREVREKVLVCGYCGKYALQGAFCSACLDSSHLKEEDLYLLRLLPCSLFMPKREPLTEEEKATLLPLYVERQTKGTESRAVQHKAKVRKDVEEKYRKGTKSLEEEYRGMTWLLDHEVNIENCIYYDHVQKFSFGWREPVSDAVKSKLLDILVEFPFAYEIKAVSGKVDTRP